MKNKGMVTVEASLCVPAFLFFMLGILYLYMVILTDAHVHQALAEAASYTAQQAYLEEKINPSNKGEGLLNNATLNLQFGNYFEGDPYAEKVIVGGSKGIIITAKPDTNNSKIFIAKARYLVGVKIPLIGKWTFYRENQIKQKNFVGYSKEEQYGEVDEYVYITPEQSVYHTRRSCTHLMLSIRSVLARKRSEYESCCFCGRRENKDGKIYIARTSTVYHNSKYCSGLKRTIYRVKKKEVKGLGPCSRCGG